MTTSAKSKKIAKAAALEIKHEILGSPKKKPELKDRSTMDIMLGRYKKPKVDDRPSPVVEAMLQTRESEEAIERQLKKESEEKANETAKRKPKASNLDTQMQRDRQVRTKSEADWSKSQEAIFQSPKKTQEEGPLLPTSPKKGPSGPGNRRP